MALVTCANCGLQYDNEVDHWACPHRKYCEQKRSTREEAIKKYVEQGGEVTFEMQYDPKFIDEVERLMNEGGPPLPEQGAPFPHAEMTQEERDKLNEEVKKFLNGMTRYLAPRRRLRDSIRQDSLAGQVKELEQRGEFLVQLCGQPRPGSSF
jgi:hypothetical protein